MKKLLFIFLFLPVLAYSQGGTWPIKYNDSDPSGAPSASGTRVYFNTATNTLFFWEPAPSSTWRKQPKSFDQISGCAAPAYTPTARQSIFAVNSCSPPELYQYTGSAWELLNAGTTYTAGTGIDITGDVISNTGDLSSANELNTALSVTSGNLRLTDAGGNLDVPVSSIAPVQAVAAGAGISVSGTTTRTVTNSAPDQTVVLTNGAGISATGTYPNFTIASTITQADGSETKINVGTGLSKSGSGTTGSPYVLTNAAPDQTVAISAGTGIGVTGTYPNFTVTNTAPNVVQELSISGSDLSLSGGGGTVALPGGSDGNGIYDGSGEVFIGGRAHLDSIGNWAIGELAESADYKLLNWDYTERQYGLILDTLRISAVIASKTDPFTGGIGYQNILQVNDSSIVLRQVKAGQFTYIQCIDDKGAIVCSEVNVLDTAKVEMLISADSFMVIDERLGGPGIQYQTDLSANFKDNSLITKKWVNAYGKNIFSANDTLTTGGRVGLGQGAKAIFFGKMPLSGSVVESSSADQNLIGIGNRDYGNPAGGNSPFIYGFVRDSILQTTQYLQIADGNTSFNNFNNSALPLQQNTVFLVGTNGYQVTAQDEINGFVGEGSRMAALGGSTISSLQNSRYDISSGDNYESTGLYSLLGFTPSYPNASASLQYQFINLEPVDSYRDKYSTFVGHNQPGVGAFTNDGPYNVARSFGSAQVESDMWAVRQHTAIDGEDGYSFDWVNVNFTEDDTTGNRIEFYNRKYAFPNSSPGVGEKSIVWDAGVPNFKMQPFNGNYADTGTATTAFTVTLPTIQPDATYSVSIMPKNALSATGWYISARTTTTFTVTYLTGLTGAVDFDYIIVN